MAFLLICSINAEKSSVLLAPGQAHKLRKIQSSSYYSSYASRLLDLIQLTAQYNISSVFTIVKTVREQVCLHSTKSYYRYAFVILKVITFEEAHKDSELIRTLTKNAKISIANIVKNIKLVSMNTWNDQHFSLKQKIKTKA